MEYQNLAFITKSEKHLIGDENKGLQQACRKIISTNFHYRKLCYASFLKIDIELRNRGWLKVYLRKFQGILCRK